jgi:hypothetical protein
MKNTLILSLLFLSVDLFSQNNQPARDMTYRMDSLELWNYDILPLNKDDRIKENNPVSKIVFFRIAAVRDSMDKNLPGSGNKNKSAGLKPAVIFNVYPVSVLVKIKAMSKKVILTSSCQPPDRGGNYYELTNFVLLNLTSCTLCATTSNRQVDLCKGNIDRILSVVANKEYKSFEKLCKDLPVKKGKYY